ncbi:uroporphyrinogen decarboxylase family protein [Eubacteriaceae bacterium ES3]|nr:uroporphyrinogen decarboxylase family protein [Eubacteriaceae bacterium ES3]
MGDTYEEKIKRIITTVNHQEPDKVPILSLFETYSIAYAGGTVQEMTDHPEKEIEYYCAPHKDIYSDVLLAAGLVFDAKSAECMGSESHFVSEDGTTVQHKEMTPMEADEYPELIADPEAYIFNKMLPRKAKKLAGNNEEKYAAIKALVDHWKMKGMVQGQLIEKLKTEYQLPTMIAGFAYPPLDYIFDYLRGFKGISMDLRRHPKEVEAACEAMYKIADGFMGVPDQVMSVPEFPFYATMMHIPTFINPKQFERFFLPTYEKLIYKIHERGGKLVMFLEGNWESKYDWLNSLPKNFAVGIIEDDDIFEAKKKIGDNITIAGGMPMEKLKLGTKEECKDYAKKLIDELAPGGGYIFSTDRAMLSGGDAKAENLIETFNFVHEYGVYK